MNPEKRAAVLRACKAYGITSREFHSRRRFRRFSHARWQAWAELRSKGWSLPEIAGAFGVHHTSVLHGIRKITK